MAKKVQQESVRERGFYLNLRTVTHWKRLPEEHHWRPLFSGQKNCCKNSHGCHCLSFGQWKYKGVDNLSWSILVLFSMILYCRGGGERRVEEQKEKITMYLKTFL